MRVDDEVVYLHGILKPVQKSSAVFVVEENILLGIASSDDVVKSAWVLDSKGSGHMLLCYHNSTIQT